MKAKPILILTLLVLFCSINVSGQKERFVPPADQASKDPSFKRFRDTLIKTVKSKNAKRLMAIVSGDIKLSFGGDEGIKDFNRIWKPSDSKSKIWRELEIILKNGGTFYAGTDRKTFCAPYLFTTFPDDIDAFSHQAIFGKNVNLREKPNLSSKVIARLSYNVVTADMENSVTSTADVNDYIWIKIKTLGGKTGYVGAKFVRSSIDYRACFERIRGRWKMTALIAGD